MSTAYLGLGSNLGDRKAFVDAAIDEIDTIPGTSVTAVSSVIETEPVGVTGQPRFLNAAVRIETEQAPEALLRKLKELEEHLGRKPTYRWGPRVIDIDILLYDDVVLETEELVIPHPLMMERRFVLAPLAELAPDLRHPVTRKTVSELLSRLECRERCQPEAGTRGTQR